MIRGAHAIIYSRDPEADRAFFKDVLKLDHVDSGGGWLIFSLPPSEVAFHPADGSEKHELYLLTKDIEASLKQLEGAGVEVKGPIHEQDWGRLAMIVLPGGGELGLYQPKHPLAPH